MTAYNYPLAVGVFQSEAEAKNAIADLENADIDRSQIGLAFHEGGVTNTDLRKALMEAGQPEDQASYYDSEFRAGHPVISVNAQGREQEVYSILRSHGAQDNAASSNYTQSSAYSDASSYAANTGATSYETDRTMNRGATSYDTDRTAGTYDTNAPSETDTQRSIRLREEQLRAEKERVQTGEARVHKEVVTEQKSIDVPVSHEEVVIERHSISGGKVSDTPLGQDETIRIPVSEEQVHVTKTPVETGEVTIGKREVTENQRFTDQVGREEVRLDESGNPDVRTQDDIDNR